MLAAPQDGPTSAVERAEAIGLDAHHAARTDREDGLQALSGVGGLVEADRSPHRRGEPRVAPDIVGSQRLLEARQGQLVEQAKPADVVGSPGPPPVRGVGIGHQREAPEGVPEGPEGDDVPVRCDLDAQPPVAGLHGAQRRLHQAADVPVGGYAEDGAHLDGRARHRAPAARQGEALATQLEILQRHVEGHRTGAPRGVPARGWRSAPSSARGTSPPLRRERPISSGASSSTMAAQTAACGGSTEVPDGRAALSPQPSPSSARIRT